jgi:hypothetical protein
VRSRNIRFDHCSLQLAKASAATLSKNKASAATLSQQEENDSADVKRDGVNISGFLGAKLSKPVRVVGESIASGAPPLTHIFTVGACGTRPRRGPPAALPRKACHGMLGGAHRSTAGRWG